MDSRDVAAATPADPEGAARLEGSPENSAVGPGDTNGLLTDTEHKTYLEVKDADLDEDITGQTNLPISIFGGTFWGTESDLDENAYGAAAVTIVKDVTKLIHQREEGAPWEAVSLTLVRLSFCFGIMILNLCFQTLILWYIYMFVVQPSVRNVQSLYSRYHSHNFDEEGNFLADAWEDFPDKTEVCEITMSSRAFYFGILALWGLLMMMELRSCQRVYNNIMAVRSVNSVHSMLEYVSTGNYELGGRCLIVGLTEPMRYAVVLLVCLPRAIIGFILLFLGCQWLSSSASFSDMTLNAMALQFVKDIDEILYEALLPKQLTASIADTNVFVIEKRKKKVDVDNDEWKGYRRTFFWMLFMICFLGGYGTAWQTVLPFDLSELKFLCREQQKESMTPLCTKNTWGGWSEDCYPYGQVNEDIDDDFGGAHRHGHTIEAYAEETDADGHALHA